MHIPIHLISIENVTIPGVMNYTEINQEYSHFRDLVPIPVLGNDIFCSVMPNNGV